MPLYTPVIRFKTKRKIMKTSMLKPTEPEAEQTSICFISGQPCSKRTASGEIRNGFVIMPFKDPYFDYYKFGIQKTFSKEKLFNCVHVADATFMNGEYIICKICEQIKFADFIIADLSEKNPNSYYELGLAHAQAKPTIIIANNRHETVVNEQFTEYLQNQKSSYREYNDLSKLLDNLSVSINNKEYSRPFLSDDQYPERYTDDSSRVACVIFPKGTSECGGFLYNELFEYGVKDTIHNIEGPISEMANYDIEVINLLEEVGRESFKRIISYLQKTDYCIIHISKSNPEMFYWLGFIHGLRLNDKVQLNKNTNYLYITNEKNFDNIPFDVKQARYIIYESIEDLAYKLGKEFNKLEKKKLTELNKHKFDFWSNLSLSNTRFIIGAYFAFTGGKKKISLKSMTSVLDLSSFRSIAFILSLQRDGIHFNYNLHVSDLSDGILDQSEDESNLKLLFSDDPNLDFTITNLVEHPDNFKIRTDLPPDNYGYILRDKKIKNHILIGSSCVNAAVEFALSKIYQDKKNIYFKTNNLYKTRSDFWKNSKSDISGIYFNDRPVVELTPYDDKNIQDAGLLVITNLSTFRSSNLSRESEEILHNDEKLILIIGSRRFGTYGLAKLISFCFQNEQDFDKEGYLKHGSDSDKNWNIEQFFRTINQIIRDNRQYYRIEAFFKFDVQKKEFNQLSYTTTLKKMHYYTDPAGEYEEVSLDEQS